MLSTWTFTILFSYLQNKRVIYLYIFWRRKKEKKQNDFCFSLILRNFTLCTMFRNKNHSAIMCSFLDIFKIFIQVFFFFSLTLFFYMHVQMYAFKLVVDFCFVFVLFHSINCVPWSIIIVLRFYTFINRHRRSSEEICGKSCCKPIAESSAWKGHCVFG